MIKLKNILYEERKLRIFDFDDTLVKTNSYIYVTHKNGTKSKLTPGEYAKYKSKVGDEFNYSDFHSVKEPTEIKAMKKVFTRIANAKGRRSVVILTARQMYKPIRKFLKDAGYGTIYVVALGSSDPKAKSNWIEDKIKRGYTDIVFWDDSVKNVNAVKELKKKYQSIKLQSKLVNYF